MTKEQILGALPKLEKADLESIHAMCGHLIGAATGANGSKGTELGQTFFEALVALLGLPWGYQSLADTQWGRRFETKIKLTKNFLDKDFQGWDANKVGQQAFVRMLFELLIDDLKGRGVTPSLGVVSQNLQRLPEVFDNAFPDYRASGMGDMVLKRFQ